MLRSEKSSLEEVEPIPIPRLDRHAIHELIVRSSSSELRHSYETKIKVLVKQYWLSNVKKNEVRIKQYCLSSVKKNELGCAGIGKKTVSVRGWTDYEYQVESARNSRINSTIMQASYEPYNTLY